MAAANASLGDLRTWTPHVTQRSAFFELSHPRTHIFHVHNAVTACLTQLSMNFDWFHATQVEESDNHALFFEFKRRHFSIKNTTATRPRHKHSRVIQCCHLASPNLKNSHVSSNNFHFSICFHSREKKIGYLTTWTPYVNPRKYSWYSFLSEVESTPLPQCGRKDYVKENLQWHHRDSKQRPSGL